MSESAAAIIGSKFGMKKMCSFIKYCENTENVEALLPQIFCVTKENMRHRCRKFFVKMCFGGENLRHDCRKKNTLKIRNRVENDFQ